MSNSSLVTYTRLSPNRHHPRENAIHRITPHCVVGQFTAKEILDMSHFTIYDPENGSSCNYAIGKDGSIGQGVDEGDRSWCSSSGDNDHQAITIEVASDRTHPYAITGAAYAALLDLMTDICRRNGKTKLVWPGSRDAALAYEPADNELVLTAHRFFASKACPGDYMYARFGQMAEEVTKRLAGLAALDFDRAFTVFHAVFFPGKDNWIFDPAADQIILVMPQVFFRNCAILIGGVLLACCAGFILSDLLHRRTN